MARFLRRFIVASISKHNLTRSFSCPAKPAPQYRIRVAYPGDYDKVMNLMVDTYFKSEPTIVNVGGFTVEDNPTMIQLMRRNVCEGMTLVAENRYTNCLVAAAVNVGSRRDDVLRMEKIADCCTGLSPQAREILRFFAFCSRQADVWDAHCVDDVFECAHVSVHPDHQRQGLAKRLIQESWVLARDTAYRLFRIDCSSRYTAQIAEELGWKCVYSMPYGRYYRNGEFIFKCVVEPHREMKIFVDRLDNYASYYPPSRKSSK